MNNRMSIHSEKGSFFSVFEREITRMISRRLYFGVCIVLPLFCVFFMATIFGSGQMENLPIGIVDLDQTATSRNISRTIETVPTFNVIAHYTDDISARTATQQKKIYGYLVIPENFEENVLSGKTTTLSYYYHYALLSVGSEIQGAFETVLQPLAITPIINEATALGISENQIEDFLVPVNEQGHPLYNPDLDYSVYLSNPFFFILFQVIILLVTVYTIGSEIKFRTADEWLKCADMNIFTAITGKLLPYTILFIIIGIFSNYIMFGVMQIPFSCGFTPLNLTTILFVIATQALAVFLFSLFPAISIIISIVSMVGSLGATLSGVTFPAPFMFPAVYYASFLFPVRHFVEINQNLLYGDYGFAYTWQNISALFLFILPAILILPHLKKAILSHKYENIK
ncbi:MAG: ABC transporter permease [Tannerella sp.]|nr:ABC transporter permease [Tannerella sp.]